jgi:glucosamine--fructose-6-phosphate aminotransferase (isomerizing)
MPTPAVASVWCITASSRTTGPSGRSWQAKGHVFASETDTEAVARLVGEYYKGDLRKAVISALRQVEGAYGIAVVSADEPGRIVVARKGSPLVIGVGEGECLIASDPSALISHTRRVIYLDDGDVALVTADSVDITDLNHAPIDRDVAELEFEVSARWRRAASSISCSRRSMSSRNPSATPCAADLDLLNGTAVLSGMGATAREPSTSSVS